MTALLDVVPSKSQSHLNAVKVRREGLKGTKLFVFEGVEFQDGFGTSSIEDLWISASSMELVQGVLIKTWIQ